MNTFFRLPKIGDLRVWHIPQVPMHPFRVNVSSIQEAKELLPVLWEYDVFQYKHHIKPDYSNASGLEIYVEMANPDGMNGKMKKERIFVIILIMI